MRSIAGYPGLGFLMVALVFTLACPPAEFPVQQPADPGSIFPDHVAAVWLADAEETELVLGNDFESLKNQVSTLKQEQNLRLFDLERGEQLYAGLVRNGEDQQREEVDTGPWKNFNKKRQGFNKRGYRLIDFEIWDEDSQTMYAGVWASGAGGEVFVRGLGEESFHALRGDLAPTHHLVDFEMFTKDGELEIIGVWHRGSTKADSEAEFVLGETWLVFRNLAYELNERGFRPDEIETDGVFFSGRWKRSIKNDWLLVGYQQEDLQKANENLTGGVGDSLVTPAVSPNAEMPRGKVLSLVAVAVYPGLSEAPEEDGAVDGVLPVEDADDGGALSVVDEDEPQPAEREPLHDDGTVPPP